MHIYSNGSNANAAAKKFIGKYPGRLTLASPERAPGVTAMYYGGVHRVKDTTLTDAEVKDITNTIRLLDADAVQEQDDEPAPKPKAARSKKAAAKGGKKKPAKKAKAPKAKSDRVTKTDQALNLMRRKGGVTNEELQKAMTWQPHSVRGFVSNENRLNNRGIKTVKVEGKPTAYVLE